MSAHDDDTGNGKPNVAVVGRFQIGKSTLINCLLDDRVARTGEGIATTRISTIYTYGQIPSVDIAGTWKGDKVVWEDADFRLRDFLNPDKSLLGASAARISLWKPLLQNINLIDTPGIDANADDTAQAVASLGKADFVIVLLENKGLGDVERGLFADLERRNLPFTVIINCRDRQGKRWFPDHNGEIVRSVSAELANLGHRPTAISGKEGVWACNLLWFWHASEHIFEEPDAADLCRDITEYFDRHLKKRAASALTLAHSKFEPVRHFFEDNLWKKRPGGNTLFFASPKTMDFLRELGRDHDSAAGTFAHLLPKCWFPATPAGKAARELASHFDHYQRKSDAEAEREKLISIALQFDAVAGGEIAKKIPLQEMEAVQGENDWHSKLIAISGKHAIPDDPAWRGDLVDALTSWILPVIRNAPNPYLARCNQIQRDACLHSYAQYLKDVEKRVAELRKNIKTVFVDLQEKYRKLRPSWEFFQQYATDARDYQESGTFSKMFKSYEPDRLRSRARSFLEYCDAFVKLGNERLNPVFDKCVDLWKGALEPLSDVIRNVARHGQDLAPLTYRVPLSVNGLSPLMDGAFAGTVTEWLDGVLADREYDDAEKERIYCIHRKLGFASRKQLI